MAVSQSHYRFGVNEGTESTHGWYAAEDASPAPGGIALDTTFLLRFTLQCDGTALNNIDAEFQYRKNGGAWTQITTGTTNVRAVTPSCWADGANTTKRLSGTGTFEASSAGCTADGISGGTAFDIVANGNGETECAMQLRSADLSPGDLIEFRLTRDGGILLDTYAVTPSLQLREAVSRPRLARGPFPFPKAIPDFLPTTPSSDVTVGLTGIAASAMIGALTATLTLGMSGQGVLGGTGSMSGNFAVYPEVERSKIVRGPFPFPKAVPAFPISTNDKTVALVGSEAIATAGFLTAPPVTVDRPVYVIGPAPFLTSGPFRFQERPRAVIFDTANTTGGPLSGQSATGSPGTLTATRELALTGQAVTGGQGTLTPLGDSTQALTGQSATASPGTLTAGITPIALTGFSVTGATGALASSSPGEATLSGLLAQVSQGTLTVAPTPDVVGAADIPGQGSYHRTIKGSGSHKSTISGKGAVKMLAWHIDEDDDFFIGEDKSLTPFTVYQADKRTRQNITGWTISWMLKRSLTDPDVDALLTKTTGAGITLTTPTSGICTITIADTDTDSLEPGRYYHEVKRMDAGNETVLSQGRCVLRRAVHRS